MRTPNKCCALQKVPEMGFKLTSDNNSTRYLIILVREKSHFMPDQKLKVYSSWQISTFSRVPCYTSGQTPSRASNQVKGCRAGGSCWSFYTLTAIFPGSRHQFAAWLSSSVKSPTLTRHFDTCSVNTAISQPLSTGRMRHNGNWPAFTTNFWTPLFYSRQRTKHNNRV